MVMAYSVLPLALDGWGAGDNKKSLLRSSINPQDFYDPQHLGHLYIAVDGWGAGDNKKSLLRSSINSKDFYDPIIAFGSPPSSIVWIGSRRQ